ncbi:thiolase family protein [Halobacillus shinanisalinarum]|uniref:Thiolase family protein n=1 Tax=Halobacillus shinanisalinarum TaxID=2932258 RepID=A0ABY4H5N9_9BACI|nr:thiolase family protein [Halobacillus shinanisalinarum]UOQ95415.1 thiolase family protein [Halobacillus shinanisalinarum]
MKEVVIVKAKRTPVGRVGGVLSHIPPEKLMNPILKDLIQGLDPGEIDDVILGNVVGPGGNMARLSLLEAGLPMTVPGVTIDRQCGSGLEAINIAGRLVQAGAGDIYIAGGVESTSLAPWKVKKPDSIHSPKGPELYTRARFSPESIGDPEMGEAAENVAEHYGVTREEQDEFAYRSHLKAVNAQSEGVFDKEIVPKDGIRTDECPRPNTSLAKLSTLKPVFKQGGTVTAGNACPMNDGAAAVLIMSLEKCRKLGLKPLARFVDSTSVGVDPHLLGIGPIPAVKKLWERQHLTEKDIDLVEFNEAFASQVIASLKSLEIPYEKVNRSGGALALGHPYGASGAILVTRLVSELAGSSLKRGIVTLGIGGGMGLATLFESMEDVRL